MARPSTHSAREIAEEIERLVTSRRSGAGELLPSLRDLSLRYDVSHETVRRAYQALEARGLVTKKAGLGFLIPPADQRGEARPNPLDQALVPTGESFLGIEPSSSAGNSLTFQTCEHHAEKIPLWSRLIASFCAGHPLAKVQMVPSQLTPERLRRESPADVLHSSSWLLADLADRGRILNLSPWTSDEPIFRGALMADFRVDQDPCWFVPITFNTPAVYVNPCLIGTLAYNLLRSRWRMESLMDWAVRVGKEGKGPFSVSLLRPHLLVYCLGVDLFDAARLEANRVGLLEALERLRAWFQLCPFYEPDSLSRDANERLELFIAGRAGIAFYHTFAIPDAIRRMTFDWEVWPLPLEGSLPIPKITLACAVSKDCSCPDLAFEFIRFLAGPDAQSLLAAEKNNIPVLRTAAVSESFLSPPPRGLDFFLSAMTSTREIFEPGGEAFFQAYTAAFDKEILRFLLEDRPVNTTVDRLTTCARQLLKAYGLVETIPEDTEP
ncbi:MAG: extracellular solute-binding protein [Planctomycetes bacterium]|nr:extracellular solute-binding protein [Planctomycetota bacterium]